MVPRNLFIWLGIHLFQSMIPFVTVQRLFRFADFHTRKSHYHFIRMLSVVIVEELTRKFIFAIIHVWLSLRLKNVNQKLVEK